MRTQCHFFISALNIVYIQQKHSKAFIIHFQYLLVIEVSMTFQVSSGKRIKNIKIRKIWKKKGEVHIIVTISLK